jgi:hypothetical protein
LSGGNGAGLSCRPGNDFRYVAIAVKRRRRFAPASACFLLDYESASLGKSTMSTSARWRKPAGFFVPWARFALQA